MPTPPETTAHWTIITHSLTILYVKIETEYDHLGVNKQSLSPENDYDKTSYRSLAGTAVVPVLVPDGNPHAYEDAVINSEAGETLTGNIANHYQ